MQPRSQYAFLSDMPRKHCKKNDLQVEADAPVAEVVEIVLNASGDGSVAAEAVDLGPSSDSGFAIMVGIIGL